MTAASKGWNVPGDANSHYEDGIRASMQMLNSYYDIVTKISDEEIDQYIAANPLGDNPREAINTRTWILHLTNPCEGWANLRRSDYPALADRTLLPVRGDFPHEAPVVTEETLWEGEFNVTWGTPFNELQAQFKDLVKSGDIVRAYVTGEGQGTIISARS